MRGGMGCGVVEAVTDHEDLAAFGGQSGHAGGFLGGEDARLPLGDAQTVSEVKRGGFGVAGEEFDLWSSSFHRADCGLCAGAEAVDQGEGVGLLEAPPAPIPSSQEGEALGIGVARGWMPDEGVLAIER